MYEKKFLGFPLFVSLQTMQKTSAFFFFFSFLLWHRPVEKEGLQNIYRHHHFNSYLPSHTDTWIYMYIQTQCGFSLGPANESLQPVQKDDKCTWAHRVWRTHGKEHYRFVTHEVSRRKKRGVTAHTHCFKMYITHTGYEKHAH